MRVLLVILSFHHRPKAEPKPSHGRNFTQYELNFKHFIIQFIIIILQKTTLGKRPKFIYFCFDFLNRKVHFYFNPYINDAIFIHEIISPFEENDKIRNNIRFFFFF